MAKNQKVQITLTAVDKTKAAFRSVTSSLKTLGGTVAKYASQLGLAFGAGGGGLLAGVKSMANEFDRIAKTADKLGTTTEELSKLRYAGELTGVAAGKMDTALQRMTRRLSEAAKGTGAAKDALLELGLDAQELARQTPEEAFKQIADAMVLVENQSDRVRLAFKLFDSEGVALVNTLAKGREGIEAMGQELENLGGVIDSEAARAAEELNDNLTRMDRNFAALGQTIGNELIPKLNETVTFWNALAQGDSLDLALAKMDEALVGINPQLSELNAELALTRQRLNDLQEDQEGMFGFLVPEYAISEAKERIKRLEGEVTKARDQELAKRAASRERQARIEGRKEETARIQGEEEARKQAVKPKTSTSRGNVREVTGDPLIDNRLAAQRGDISNEEYRRKRSEIIRQSSGPAGQSSFSSISAEEVAQMIATATDRAMKSRTFVVKVQPELVGIDGIEIAARDTADKEGVHE